MKKIIAVILALVVIAGFGLGCTYLGYSNGHLDGYEDGLNDAFDIVETAEDEGMIAISNLHN